MHAFSDLQMFPFAAGTTEAADDHPPPVVHAPGEIMSEIADELDHAILVIAESNKLVYCNLPGQRLLEQKTLLVRSGGTITTCDPIQRRHWHQSLFSALAGARKLVILKSGTESVPVSVSRLTGRQASGVGANVLVLVGRRPRPEPWAIRAFAERYRLTPAEHRVLCRLQLGHTAPQIAENLRVAESTIRTQIKNMLVKVGANGIKPLLLRIASLPPVGTEQWSTFTSPSATFDSGRYAFPKYRYTRRERGLSAIG